MCLGSAIGLDTIPERCWSADGGDSRGARLQEWAALRELPSEWTELDRWQEPLPDDDDKQMSRIHDRLHAENSSPEPRMSAVRIRSHKANQGHGGNNGPRLDPEE